jgi:hypothetical protein
MIYYIRILGDIDDKKTQRIECNTLYPSVAKPPQIQWISTHTTHDNKTEVIVTVYDDFKTFPAPKPYPIDGIILEDAKQ